MMNILYQYIFREAKHFITALLINKGETIMLMKRTWFSEKIYKGCGFTWRYKYTGWFLLGIIPLYLDRERIGT
jgi:hypothetical protein